MKRGLFLILAVLGMRSAVAVDEAPTDCDLANPLCVIATRAAAATRVAAGSCSAGEVWQCRPAQPPALGVFCGCVSSK